LSHDGEKKSWEDEFKFAERLQKDGHLTPLEHPATEAGSRYANYEGWRSLRYDLEKRAYRFTYDPTKRPDWTK
jgi:hypothetical protein